VTEAGGLVTDLAGNDKFMERGQIVAASPKIFTQLLQTLQPHMTAKLKA
jgi:myo-inositol-1(or 4)-monophosphatase